MKKKITIIDYGAGNILSVSRAFNECNASVEIQSDPKKIKNASFLVLPGDGSFSYASNRLKKTNIFEILKKHFEKGNPLLGICLGMQMLLSKSEEFGNNIGLSIIKGKIIHLCGPKTRMKAKTQTKSLRKKLTVKTYACYSFKVVRGLIFS